MTTENSNRVKLVPVSDGSIFIEDSLIVILRDAAAEDPFEIWESSTKIAATKSVTQALSIAVGRYHQLKDFEALLRGEELKPTKQRVRKEGDQRVSKLPNPA
jgi:hypothetical protein